MVRMFETESSIVKEIGYDQERKELFVRLKTSPLKLYRYENVKMNDVFRCLNAESVGKIYNEIIKNHQYQVVSGSDA